MTFRKLGIILAAILVATSSMIVLVAGMGGSLNPRSGAALPGLPADIRMEIIKSLLQLTVVSVLGGAVAGLFKALESARTVTQKNREEATRKSRLRAQIHEEYLRRIGQHYRCVKSSRRTLRAAGLTSKYEPPETLTAHQITALAEEMNKINTSQLELEGMMIESQRLPVFMAVKDLSSCLHTMEDYLRNLLREYEECMPQLRAEASVQFATLVRLRAFTGSTRDEGEIFLTDFADPYEQIVSKIGRSIARDEEAAGSEGHPPAD